MKRYALAFFLSAFALVSNAGSIGSSQSGWSYFPHPDGSVNVVQGSNLIGSIPAPSTPPVGSVATIGSYGVAPSGGSLAVRSSSGISVAGNPLVVDVEAKVVKASLGAALGRFVAKVFPVLNYGIALYDLAEELGYHVSKGSDGLPTFTKDSQEPTTLHYFSVLRDTRFTAATPTATCEAFARTQVSVPFGIYYQNPAGTPPDAAGNPGNCTFEVWNYGYLDGTTQVPAVYNRSQRADIYPMDTTGFILSQKPVPAADFVKSATDYSIPDGDTVMPQILKDIIRSGDSVDTQTPTVTGPASTPGPSSVTKNADGTTTTQTTTNNFTYNGDTITSSNVVNNSNYNPTTNTTTNTTTTTTNPAVDGSPSDTVNPGLPKLYDPKYPKGLIGVWDSKKADLLASPLLNLVGHLQPTGIGSGGCPQFSITMDLSVWNFGTYNLGPPCYVWDFVKVVVLIGAGLLARALIFGG